MPVICPGDSSLVKNNFIDSSEYVLVISKVDVLVTLIRSWSLCRYYKCMYVVDIVGSRLAVLLHRWVGDSKLSEHQEPLTQ
jgi:hypothetical protein